MIPEVECLAKAKDARPYDVRREGSNSHQQAAELRGPVRAAARARQCRMNTRTKVTPCGHVIERTETLNVLSIERGLCRQGDTAAPTVQNHRLVHTARKRAIFGCHQARAAPPLAIEPIIGH